MLSSPNMFWVALKFSHYFTTGLLNAENKAKYGCGLHARDCGLLLKFAKPHSSKVQPGNCLPKPAQTTLYGAALVTNWLALNAHQQ